MLHNALISSPEKKFEHLSTYPTLISSWELKMRHWRTRWKHIYSWRMSTSTPTSLFHSTHYILQNTTLAQPMWHQAFGQWLKSTPEWRGAHNMKTLHHYKTHMTCMRKGSIRMLNKAWSNVIRVPQFNHTLHIILTPSHPHSPTHLLERSEPSDCVASQNDNTLGFGQGLNDCTLHAMEKQVCSGASVVCQWELAASQWTILLSDIHTPWSWHCKLTL